MALDNHYITYLNDPVYKRKSMRRKFCNRILLGLFSFGVSLYLSVLLFGDLKNPKVINLTDLGRCPVCYGITVCPELYSNQITVDKGRGWTDLFNAKNVYFGYTKTNRRVILKKLAHDWEFRQLDTNFCKNWGLIWNCNVKQPINNSIVNEKIIKLVHYNVTEPDLEPRKGLVMCPYPYSISDFVKPAMNTNANQPEYDMMYIWTMLSINPEPIVLQVIPKSKGWPVPAYGGVCGRIELVAHEGEPISSLLHLEWHRKLVYSKKILNAAMDFTFRHDRFRFYLMDWSLDNIVVNNNDDVTFVDLEDIIVLDKHISPKTDLPDWYKRDNKVHTDDGFVFSIQNICKHHLSDHNIWAACYLLAGPNPSLLYPIPHYVNAAKPQLDKLLQNCLYKENRISSILQLLRVIEDLLQDEHVVGYGAVGAR